MDKTLLYQCKRYMTQFVYDTVALEDSPFTLPEVQTLLDGVTVGGHTLSDQQLVLNQKESWKYLFQLIESEQFNYSKESACKLQGYVANEEALEWGCFRTGGVRISGTDYRPPAFDILDSVWAEMVFEIDLIADPMKKAIVFFLQMARNQFFWDGNKRTGRLIMNGVLLSSGLSPILVPSKAKLEFNQKMVRFYNTNHSAEMIDFLTRYQIDFS